MIDDHSTFHDLWLLMKWTRLLWRTARTLTLIARGHCACHPRKAMMAIPHAMNLWIKPTNPHATAAVVDLWSQTTWTQPTWTQPTWTQLHMDPAPVEDSTDSDCHCERTLCLSSQEGHGGQSTDHDYMDKTHKIHTLQQRRGGFTATDHGPMGSHISTGYSSPGGSTGSRSGIMAINEVDLAPVEDGI